MAASINCTMQIGGKLSRWKTRSKSSTCSTGKHAWERTQGNLPFWQRFLLPIIPIIRYPIMLRYSGDGGTTSSDLLAWPRRPNSRTRRPSNTTLKFPTNTGPVSSGPKESRIEPNNRRGLSKRRRKYSNFLPVSKIAGRLGSPRFTPIRTAMSYMMSSSTR